MAAVKVRRSIASERRWGNQWIRGHPPPEQGAGSPYRKVLPQAGAAPGAPARHCFPIVRIRTETRADRNSVREVPRAAFGREAEARLVDRLRQSPAFLPEL